MSNYFFTKYPKLLVENPIIFITVANRGCPCKASRAKAVTLELLWWIHPHVDVWAREKQIRNEI